MVIVNQTPVKQPEPPAELFVCPFDIIQDTSEQLPWTFQGIAMGGKQMVIKRHRKSLDTGDYSIAGLEHLVTIERKSPADLAGSVVGGHRRLEAEHERMLAMIGAGGFACLICEGSLSVLDDELRAEGRHNAAEAVMGCSASWPMRFQTPWYFAGDRRRAELLAFRILWKWWDKVGRLKEVLTDGAVPS